MNVLDAPIDQVVLVAQAKGNMNKTFSEKVLCPNCSHKRRQKDQSVVTFSWSPLTATLIAAHSLILSPKFGQH